MGRFTPSKMTFKGYKCFIDESTIPWFSSFNVIIGRNNSGKSSFIDIIHSLCDANFHANVARDIDLILTYPIEDYEYFDIDNLAAQTYKNRSQALQYFGFHFNGREFNIPVNLTDSNLGRVYLNSYKIEPEELSDGRCSLRIRDGISLDPFSNSIFRCISSERDINPESFFSGADPIDIASNGIGTTRYVCSILNNKNKNDVIIQDDVLNAFNEILGPDGHYRNKTPICTALIKRR